MPDLKWRQISPQSVKPVSPAKQHLQELLRFNQYLIIIEFVQLAFKNLVLWMKGRVNRWVSYVFYDFNTILRILVFLTWILFMLTKSRDIDYGFLTWDCFLKSCKRKRINIKAFWMAALQSPPARLIRAAVFKDLKRTICIKKHHSLVWAWAVPNGFPWGLPCNVTWEGPVAITGGPGQRGRGKALRWGVARVHATGVALAAAAIRPHSQPPKQEGWEASHFSTCGMWG